MSEKLAVADPWSDCSKKVVAKFTNGKWTVRMSVKPGEIPVTVPDVNLIRRACRVAQRTYIQELNRSKVLSKKE